MSLAEKALRKTVGVAAKGGKAVGRFGLRTAKAAPGAAKRIAGSNAVVSSRSGGNSLGARAVRLGTGIAGASAGGYLMSRGMDRLQQGDAKGLVPLAASTKITGTNPFDRVRDARESVRGVSQRGREMTGMDVVASLQKASDFSKQASLSQTVQTAMALTAATAGVGAGIKLIGKGADRLKSEVVWNKLKKQDPTLAKDPVAREHFEVLQQFSPSIASNKTTARSFLDRTRRLGVMPHEMVDQLAGTEDRLSRGSSVNMAINALPSSMSTASNIVSSQRSHDLNVDQSKRRAKMEGVKLKMDAAKGKIERKKLKLMTNKDRREQFRHDEQYPKNLRQLSLNFGGGKP